MENLLNDTSPRGNSRKTYSQKIGSQVLDASSGEVDPLTKVEANASASILIDMADYQKVVVTPEDIQSAADMGAGDLMEVSSPEVAIKIKSRLPSLGLIEIDSSFSEKWNHWDKIWIAPIFPQLEDLDEELDNPSAISTPVIRDIVTNEFSSQGRGEGEAFGYWEFDEKEIDAGMAQIRRELDEKWAPIDGTEDLVWAHPGRVDERLRSEGDVLSLGQMTEGVAAILEHSPYVEDDLIPDEVGATHIGSLANVLQNSHGWKRLGTSSEISWYRDVEAFEEDYREEAVSAQEILSSVEGPPEDRRDVSLDELRMARTFFEFNQAVILEQEDTTRQQIEEAVKRLSFRINTAEQETRLESSVPGDNLSSKVKSPPKSELRIAIEFEEKLEDLRMEGEDEDDEDEDKGISGIRY